MNLQPRMDIAAKPSTDPLHILLAGAVLGLSANYLIWGAGPNGPGFAVWIMLLALATVWLARDMGNRHSVFVAIWAVVATLAAGLLVFRNLDILLPAMWLIIFSAAAMIFLHIRVISLADARVPDLFVALLQVPLHAIAGAAFVLWSINVPTLSTNPRFAGILRGVLIALPMLVIFTLLFSSADAAFSRLLPDVDELFSITTMQRLFLTGFFGWVATGLLKGACQNSPAPLQPHTSRFRFGAEETAVIMGLLAVLFITFVVLQITYLFGGRATIEATTGLTLAEYARRGFFELIVVAGLTLAILLFLGATSSSRRLFKALAAVLTGCVLIILASALQRFDLYIDAYGLTVDRLVALTVLIWFALGLVLFAGTVLREQAAWFAASMAICGIAVTLLFGLLNPAYQVARVNIERTIHSRQDNGIVFQPSFDAAAYADTVSRMNSNGAFDLDYLLSLGADAVPVLLAHIDQLAPHEQCTAAGSLLGKWNSNDPIQNPVGDWRSWNASRAAAASAVKDQAQKLEQIIRSFQEDFGFLLTTPLVGIKVC
jgi:hypothetical protein